jgi:hypothetical protein
MSPVAVRGQDAELRTLFKGAWSSLPALLVGSVVFCVAGSVAVFAAPGVNAVSIALCGLLVAPAFAGLVGAVDIISADDEPGLRDWWRLMRTAGPLGLKHALVPTACAELFLAALLVWDDGKRPLALPSLALTGAATILTVALWMAVVTVSGRCREVRGRQLWLLAIRLFGSRPVRFAAVYCLGALGVWAAVAWSASLLLVVPAPVALVLVAAVRTTALESGAGVGAPS